MRANIALAIALLVTTPSLASEACSWTSESGSTLVQNVPGEVEVDGTERCAIKANGPGNPVLTAMCEDGDWAYFKVKSAPDADYDLLIFRNQAWYCR